MTTETTVRLSLSSEITDDESGEREQDTRELVGLFRAREGLCRLTYAEPSEGGEVQSELLLSDGRVRLCRTGALRSDIVFTEGLSHSSLYEIPPYRFDMTVTTERVRVALDGARGDIELCYRTELGGASRHCRLTLRVTPCDK